jgi:hypothetical protein
MSLRCSLLGHEYSESEIERERQERGNEVVISVVQLERCHRCDHTRTISENTEVTQHPDRTPSTERDEPEVDEPTGSTTVPTEKHESVEPDYSIFAPDPDHETEDAEIVDPRAEAEAEIEPEAGDGPIDWPDHDTPETDARTGDGAEPDAGTDDVGTGAWPSVEGDDEGFDAATPDGERADVEFGGGLTPRRAEGGAEILENESDRSPNGEGADTEFVHPERSITPDKPVDVGSDIALYCPGCDASNLDHRHSLRAGDICPICHRGYLTEKG